MANEDVSFVCPKCKKGVWRANTLEKYYHCKKCNYSLDYMVEDSYIESLEEKWLHTKPV